MSDRPYKRMRRIIVHACGHPRTYRDPPAQLADDPCEGCQRARVLRALDRDYPESAAPLDRALLAKVDGRGMGSGADRGSD